MSINLLWKILLYGWTAGEIYLAVRTRTSKGAGKLSDRGTLWILWLTMFSSIFAAEWSQHLVLQSVFPGAHWPRYAAVALLLAGLIIRWTAIVSLGRAFSVNVAIRADQTLYQGGLYRLVRHPSYTGMLFIFAALALAERSWFAFILLLTAPTIALLYRIHVEEIALREGFGDAYIQYSQRTHRLIPGIY